MRISMISLLLAATAGTPALTAPAQGQNFREGGLANANTALPEVAMVMRQQDRLANHGERRAKRAQRRDRQQRAVNRNNRRQERRADLHQKRRSERRAERRRQERLADRGAERRQDRRVERRWDRGQDRRAERRRERRQYRRAERRWERREAHRNWRRWKRQAWRADRRYSWRYHRNYNRHIYRSGRYYAPYRGYRYRRFDVGLYIDAAFFGSRYWLNDPWRYRLPAAYDPYRWVRYFDDVLLIDTRDGYVVDVIHDFFW